MAEPGVRRRGVGQRAFYAGCQLAFRVLFRVVLPARVDGVSNVPRVGGALLVANHQSYLDPLLIGAWLGRQFHPVARAGLFRSRLFGPILRTVNAITVKEDGEPDAAAIRRAVALLSAGELVLVFPEGTRTETGEIGPFRRGAAVLIRRGGAPVVPVAVEGAFEAWPRGRPRPRLFARVGVSYGPPIPAEALLAAGPDAALDRLRGEIHRLKAGLDEPRRATR